MAFGSETVAANPGPPNLGGVAELTFLALAVVDAAGRMTETPNGVKPQRPNVDHGDFAEPPHDSSLGGLAVLSQSFDPQPGQLE